MSINKKLNPLISRTASALFTFKVDDPILIDLTNMKALTYDYLIICTSQSEAQMRAILNNISKSLRRHKYSRVRMEYSPGAKWGILDCGELIIHIFEKNTRNFYSLERLWSDAVMTKLQITDFVTRAEEEVEEDEFI